jgi:hypothetical protein
MIHIWTSEFRAGGGRSLATLRERQERLLDGVDPGAVPDLAGRALGEERARRICGELRAIARQGRWLYLPRGPREADIWLATLK